MTTIVRGVVAFAWTFFIGEWVQSAGAALPFGIFGMRKNKILPEKGMSQRITDSSRSHGDIRTARSTNVAIRETIADCDRKIPT